MNTLRKLVAWLNYVLNKPSPGDLDYPHHLPDNSFANRLLMEKKILELYRKLVIMSDAVMKHPRSKKHNASWAIAGIFSSWNLENRQLMEDVGIDISYYHWFPVVFTPTRGYYWVLPKPLLEFRP